MISALPISLFWLLPSIAHVEKHRGHTGLACLSLAAFVGIVTLLTATAFTPGTIWFLAPCLALIATFPAVYELANSGVLGGGSDRDDALNVALHALLSSASPYRVDTYLGNSPTPMPGALLLALPFHLLGNAAFQNPFWLLIFGLWCRSHFPGTAWGLVALAVLVCGSPAGVQDFLVGGDYLVNALYVLMAAELVRKAHEEGSPRVQSLSTAMLAIAISSRPIYAVVPLVLAGHLLHSHGKRPTVHFALVVGILSALLNLPLFLDDPGRFPLMHLIRKLDGMQGGHMARYLLPALALVVASSAMLSKRLARAPDAVPAASLATVLYPAIIMAALDDPAITYWMWTAVYSLPVSVFATIAILEHLAGSRSTAPRA